MTNQHGRVGDGRGPGHDGSGRIDLDNRRHYGKGNHHPSGHLVIRTVRITPRIFPRGCNYHTFVGQTPIYSHLSVRNTGYYEDNVYPAYFPAPTAYPVPTYQNAPQFGAGSDFPPEVSYQVDPTSQLSTQEIKFQRNSGQLADGNSLFFLQNLAAALNSSELIDENFVVEGHASAEGSSTYNRELSQLRANSVFEFLVSQGVNPVRLLAVGHGEDFARYAATDPEYLRAEDRRVMIFKLAKE